MNKRDLKAVLEAVRNVRSKWRQSTSRRMNREIKFRGKTLYGRHDHYVSPEPDTKEGTWVYGDLITEYPYHKGLTIVENGVYHEVAPETVGQYTGLKDKNGAEIFEGDIVRHMSIGRKITYIVAWDVGSGAFYYKPTKGTGGHRMFVNGSGFAPYEIIGNVHDNPELLEVE